ncbi:3-oxoacyl-[acyl-carrier-protein] synthase II [Desulfonauticus submarinus]|uniref:3-oxoacyl-[acyl-carrier-protein] synthase II n=1 Tax=Desulfonauticus submarinus TaxID=206665 RepID=A0A1H0FTP5_9BACT|nr:beta-ketoacyl synthase N-terminal-like domain-containing protein [Desulfonauticus submarinus]SDN97932.1 3-oxoacyl-[acyl-carrier-protein] synthase II [Desulfonauticus submarinus]
MRLAITGIGLVGSFGYKKKDILKHFQNAANPTKQTINTPFGKIDIPVFLAKTESLKKFTPLGKLRRVNHFSRLALLGAFLALQDAKIDIKSQSIGLILATGYGPAKTTFGFLDSLLDADIPLPSPNLFANSVHNIAATNIAIFQNIKGPVLTISQLDLSFQSALFTAQIWLKQNLVETVLIGGVDEYCETIGYCHFRLLKNLKPHINLHDLPPLGEGAAFLCLSKQNNPKWGFLEILNTKEKNYNHTLRIFSEPLPYFVKNFSSSTNKTYLKFTKFYGQMPTALAFDISLSALILKNNLKLISNSQNLTQVIVEDYQKNQWKISL